MKRVCKVLALLAVAGAAFLLLRDTPEPVDPEWHTDIVATTFWVGEIVDPNASDGSQRISTYDSRWLESYGGCDGLETADGCVTEPRTAANNFFPSAMMPKQNPFYLDLPFDDVNDPTAFAQRCDVIPWAKGRGPWGNCRDPNHSFMKNRWVQLIGPRGAVCYGQIQDAGPARYDDARYVFGTNDERPASTEFNGAGLDVSPALNGCLEFQELDGLGDRVSWRFVDSDDVPDGPWRVLVTTSGVQ